MASPIVISARGRPSHSSATSLASFGISGWDFRVSSPTFIWNKLIASSRDKHPTSILLWAFIRPHTSLDQLVNTTLDSFRWSGGGIPIFTISIRSHISSIISKNFFVLNTLNISVTLCYSLLRAHIWSPISNFFTMTTWIFSIFTSLEATTQITTSKLWLRMRSSLLIFFKRVVFPTPPIPYNQNLHLLLLVTLQWAS